MKYFVIFGLFIFSGDVLFGSGTFSYAEGVFYRHRSRSYRYVGRVVFRNIFNLSLWYKLTDQTQWGAWFSLLGFVVTAAINIMFVPRFGYMACAWAAFFCYFSMMMVSYFIGQKKIPD